ncbi:FAD-dependent oxidoreductase [Candidatus Pacearchaeota archaeon]|nr:FAD-dependent oxidoreductase [Candidatus Pacearchaeota archaeon]
MDYDVLIIGGGPGGLSAAVYCARYGLKTAVVTRTMGGTASVAHMICNFPTYVEIKGYDMMKKFTDQVTELGVKVIYDCCESINQIKNGFKIKLTNGEKELSCKKLIYAAGTDRMKLNVKGEKEFFGKGVSYCATCDGPFYKDKKVIIVGGGDAALTSAIQLADIAKEVYIIHRRDEYRAVHAWIKAINKIKKIKQLLSDQVTEIIGDKTVTGVKLKSGKELKLDGVFIEIGSKPEISLLKDLKVKLGDKGYVITDNLQKTNISGFFVAGDVIDFPLKQITTAVSQGSVAAYSAYCELKMDE